MPQADGTIIIDTEINADGMKAGSKEVEAAVRRMAASVNDLGTKAKTALNKQVDSFAKLNQEYAAQAQKVEELKRKVAEYGNQKIPTDEYNEIQAQIDQARAKMDRLTASQEKFLAMGGSKKSNTYKRHQYDIEELANTVRYAEGELRDLENTGKAFTFGNKAKEAAADMERLAAAERKLADMNNRLGTSYSSIKGQVDDYKNSLLKSSAAQQKASGTGRNLSKSLRDTGKSANSANFGIGRMLGTSVLFSFTFQAISGVINAMKEGFTSLAQYSGTTNNSISMLMSSLETLKNSLATAFAPILNVVAPIMSKFIDMLSTAASYVSMFFAFLSGKSTYTRAVAVQKDYNASLQDTASGARDAADATDEAAKAAEEYLSPLDDINKMTEKDKSSGGGSGSGGGGLDDVGTGPMFEEVPIDNKFASLLDSVLDKLKQIRNIFMSGFWDGLGDYKPLIEELKKDLSSIGVILSNIISDKDVQAAASNFAKSFIYNLGKIAGSFASIGLTIATNIVGGIESFLSKNVARIKNWLISMFDISADLWNLLGTLSSTVSEIFSSVFGSQLAQDLTGNIIGIFASVFMGVSQLALSFGRDFLNLIIQPLVENKELIKTSLMETLQPVQAVAQSIETFVQDVISKIIDLYNSHISPFLSSLASGISSIVSTLLTAYNEHIAPVLDSWAAKFDQVLNGPIKNAINSMLGVLGKLIDLLKTLWENVLVPFINWIIKNIVPVIAPIIEQVGNTVIDLLGTVGGVIDGIMTILSGIIGFLGGVFKGDWDQAFSELGSVAEGFKKAFNAVFDFVENNILKPFDKFLSGVFSVDWKKTFGILGNGLEAFFKSVKDIWGDIKGIFEGVVKFINGTFSGDWKEAWEGIKDIFKNVFEGLADIAKIPINAIIAGFNGVIDIVNGLIGAINSINFQITVPDWIPGIGGASWGFPGFGIPTIGYIPYLASGAVIPPNKEFMAVLGDQKHGNNIEAPESLIRRIVREETGGNVGLQRIEVPVYLDRKRIAYAAVDGAKLIRMQTGKNPLELA